MLRKGLIYLRRQYNTNLGSFVRLWGLGTLGLIAVSFLVDIFLPMGGAWNFLRTFVMAPLALGLFALGYSVGLYFHYERMATGTWVPFRLRLSATWRQRVAIILAAFLLVLMYATGRGVGYTFTSASYLAIAIALLAFVRTTKEENLRDALEIPDTRDIRYEADLRERQKRREALAAAKAEEKEKKLSRKVMKNL